MKWVMLFTVCLFIQSHDLLAENKLVRLGSTTSVKSSGLLDKMKPAFEHDTGYRLQTEAAGSGKAMQLAREGNFDVLITHAPAAEQEMIDQGYADQRRPFMRNYFLIVGPVADPAKIQGLADAREALRLISASKSIFISRGDDSGTHQKELSLWKTLGIEPLGGWYFESGKSMGELLKLANEKQAYTLVDDGTWLATRKLLTLTVLVHDPKILGNTYSLLSLNKKRLPQLNTNGANVFSTWLFSKKGRSIIKSMVSDGEPLFTLIDP